MERSVMRSNGKGSKSQIRRAHPLIPQAVARAIRVIPSDAAILKLKLYMENTLQEHDQLPCFGFGFQQQRKRQ